MESWKVMPSFHLKGIVALVAVLMSTRSVSSNEVTECYTVNGADYEGSQGQVESPISHPTNFTHCVAWDETGIPEFRNLPENFCRNTNSSVFPWCFVRVENELRMKLCDIPTCKTPAYVGCFHQYLQPNNTKPLMNGKASVNEKRMKIARCLNYCRNRSYDYAGLAVGHSCFCSKWKSQRGQRRALSEANRLPDMRCREDHCVNDPVHACGGQGAVAVYNTQAGSCKGFYHDKRSGTIYSPRWPGKYQHNLTCKWEVFIPKDSAKSSIVFKFAFFDLQPVKDNLTFLTYKNIFDKNPVQVASFNGRKIPKDIEIPLVNITIISLQFRTDATRSRKGFAISFKINNASNLISPTASDSATSTDVHDPSQTSDTPPTTKPSKTLTTRSSSPKVLTTSTAESQDSSNTASNNKDTSLTKKKTTTTKTSDKESNTAPTRTPTEVIVIGVACALVVAITAIVVITIEMKRRRKKKVPNDASPPPDFKNPVTFNNGSKTVNIA